MFKFLTFSATSVKFEIDLIRVATFHIKVFIERKTTLLTGNLENKVGT